MPLWFISLAALQKTQIVFPVSTWQLKITHNSNFKVSNVPSDLQGQWVCIWYTDICVGKTVVHIK